ncbi:MAG: M81 family metallopeptidase [Rhodospirillales bacterium]|nr:M81 family metallopeptidase [Rhodospirillales bacterium]
MVAQKFVVAMMMHETNTFSPLPTPIESFSRAGALSGPSAIKEAEGTNTSLGGFIEVARKAGAEFTVPMAASAHPSGLVTKAAYEQMTTAIVDEVKKGCDAVLLALHGAMVAEHYDDGEGELLNRIRNIAPDVPIAVALDFHTQMTEAMIKGASIITGYRTYPHIDMADTARRSGRTLMRMLAGEVEPKMVWGNRPIMSSSLVHTPSREPMKTLMGMANQAEDSGHVLNASVFGGFPQADIPHLALSSVIVCDKRTAEGEILLNKILDTAWDRREGFLFHPEPLSVQVARAKSLDGGPIVMADHGDNTASGGTQDVMSDGTFVVTGPMATGTTVRMGRTAVLDTGNMQIVISEKRAEPYDLGVFTHCGIDPRRKKYVLIKSRQHFRAGFEPIAKHIVMCDGDGCTASDLKLFKYTKVKRPLYPFDLDMRLGRNEA